jgi:hypothetical protein
MSLVLAIDNAGPPRGLVNYGYRASLAAGRCQKCCTARPGVRTVGVRHRDKPHWKRLALCPTCTEIARSEGYPVIS